MKARFKATPIQLLANVLFLGIIGWAVTGQVFAADTGFSSVIESVSAVDFPKIRLMVRVFTPDGTELKFDAFQLSERKTPVATFSVELVRKEPFVSLLLDRSSSMEPVVETVKESAAAFVRGMQGPGRISLVTFASDIDLVTEFTRDQEILLTGIRKMRPWGGTALFDALYQSCEQLRSAAQIDDRKTIVLLTDGRDESPQGTPGFSTHKADEVIAHVCKNNVRVICVALGTNIDESFLKKIAVDTKGALLRAPSADKLAGIFQAIGARMMLERRYRIAYSTPSPERDGTRRELTLESRLKGLKDQGTGFYLAPSDPPPPERRAVKEGGGEDSTDGKALDGHVRTENAESPDFKMGLRTVKHEVKLGRIESPNLGTTGDIGHLEHQQLATWTDIATLSIPAGEKFIPVQDRPGATPEEKARTAELNARLKAEHEAREKWRKDFTESQNKEIGRLNRNLRQMHEDNQKAHDQHIDEVNREVDAVNESNRQLEEDNQRRVDEQTAEVNKVLENTEKDMSSEFQVPDPGIPPSDPSPEESPEPETPDTGSDDE